ncbi:MAG TPA: hypothetical protein VK213_12175 [Bacteroidales bacterium]|nr:hypothetical protein [Bacteroidales bacterium]
MGSKEIKKVFSFFEENHDHLTPSQNEFIKSMKKYFKWKRTLSGKQIDCLISMKENMQVPV